MKVLGGFILCVLCVSAVITNAEEKGTIEITTHKIIQSSRPDSRLKTTSAITFTGTAPLKPDTIIESRLAVELNTLKGKQKIDIDQRLSAVRENKTFGETFTINKVLPPADYAIVTMPSERQRNTAITFTDDQRQHLTDKYDFTVGTPLEQILFIEEEYNDLNKYIQTTEKVYSGIDNLISKNQDNLPNNNAEFAKWIRTEMGKVTLILARVPENQLTYSPLTRDTLREVCNNLVANLQSIAATVRMGAKQRGDPGKYDPISSVLVIDRNMPALLNDAQKYLTRESIFNLAFFLSSISDDFATAYDLTTGKPNETKEFESKEAAWKKGVQEYERFIKDFHPPAAGIWKEFLPLLDQLLTAVTKQMELYNAEKTPANKLDILPAGISTDKTQAKDLFKAIQERLK
ncbi:MAG: hypothetical protein HY762_05445 [Planctomycetes bacterium]|nr:hypothetical protein [Planctomycetota bacterium]